MKNKVELVIGDNLRPFYKMEFYVPVEDLQDMKSSMFKDDIPKLIGVMVLDEINQFMKAYKEENPSQMGWHTEFLIP